MSVSNANYLIDPTKLSTKVHHAPGGNSSFSLSWGDQPQAQPQRRQARLKTHSMHVPQIPTENSEPSQPHHLPQPYLPNAAQYQMRPQPNSVRQQPAMVRKTNEQNRLLEEELQYYRQKNKMLRQNIFGGQEYNEQFQPLSQRPPPNFSYNGGTQELQMAVMAQKRRVEQEREETHFNNHSLYQQQGSERTSVKVHHPPGGRSSILFG